MQFHPRKMMVTETTAATTSFNADSCRLFDCDSVLNPDGNCHGPCFAVCPSTCKFLFVDNDDNFYPLFPQPPPPPRTQFPAVPSLIPAGGHVDRKNLVVTSMSVAAAMIGLVLIVGIFCWVFKIWRSRRRRGRGRGNLSSMRRDPSAVFFATADDFIAEDHGPVIDHPIWYIHTVGLEQAVIESIAVFQYKKGEKFIDGTECSVCLSEFEEDESLRLLPKCSHAFHIPCIDTWLRSHKNCPLCRAPIVAAAVNSGAAVAAPAAAGAVESSGNLNSGEETPVENSEPATLMITMEENNDEGEDGEVRIGSGSSSSSNEVEFSDHSKRLTVLLRSHSRVPSDVMEVGMREGAGDLQGVRRSVSLDSSSAMAIYRAVENIEVEGEGEGEGEGKNLEARELKSCSKARNGGKRGTSLSFRKLIKSGSLIGLQKAPVSMKRSVSSSKASTSRHGGHESILPL